VADLLGHERPLEASGEARAAAPALAGSLHLVDQPVAALLDDRLGAVPGAALARAVEAPVMLAIEIPEDAVLVVEHHSALHFERCRPADRRRQLALDLGSRLGCPAGGQVVEYLFERLGRQVFVVIVVDLRHRGINAGAQALDLYPREFSVLGNVVLVADSALAAFLESAGPTKQPRRGAAGLNLFLPPGPRFKQGEKVGAPDPGDAPHANPSAAGPDPFRGHPPAALPLRPPQ